MKTLHHGLLTKIAGKWWGGIHNPLQPLLDLCTLGEKWISKGAMGGGVSKCKIYTPGSRQIRFLQPDPVPIFY